VDILFSYFFSLWNVITALGAAFFVSWIFGNRGHMGVEILFAFLAAWMIRPIIMLLVAGMMEGSDFLITTNVVNALGGLIFGLPCAFIGIFIHKIYAETFS
jgi:hypothetical protein